MEFQLQQLLLENPDLSQDPLAFLTTHFPDFVLAFSIFQISPVDPPPPLPLFLCICKSTGPNGEVRSSQATAHSPGDAKYHSALNMSFDILALKQQAPSNSLGQLPQPPTLTFQMSIENFGNPQHVDSKVAPWYNEPKKALSVLSVKLSRPFACKDTPPSSGSSGPFAAVASFGSITRHSRVGNSKRAAAADACIQILEALEVGENGEFPHPLNLCQYMPRDWQCMAASSSLGSSQPSSPVILPAQGDHSKPLNSYEDIDNQPVVVPAITTSAPNASTEDNNDAFIDSNNNQSPASLPPHALVDEAQPMEIESTPSPINGASTTAVASFPEETIVVEPPLLAKQTPTAMGVAGAKNTPFDLNQISKSQSSIRNSSSLHRTNIFSHPLKYILSEAEESASKNINAKALRKAARPDITDNFVEAEFFIDSNKRSYWFAEFHHAGAVFIAVALCKVTAERGAIWRGRERRFEFATTVPMTPCKTFIPHCLVRRSLEGDAEALNQILSSSTDSAGVHVQTGNLLETLLRIASAFYARSQTSLKQEELVVLEGFQVLVPSAQQVALLAKLGIQSALTFKQAVTQSATCSASLRVILCCSPCSLVIPEALARLLKASSRFVLLTTTRWQAFAAPFPTQYPRPRVEFLESAIEEIEQELVLADDTRAFLAFSNFHSKLVRGARQKNQQAKPGTPEIPLTAGPMPILPISLIEGIVRRIRAQQPQARILVLTPPDAFIVPLRNFCSAAVSLERDCEQVDLALLANSPFTITDSVLLVMTLAEVMAQKDPESAGDLWIVDVDGARIGGDSAFAIPARIISLCPDEALSRDLNSSSARKDLELDILEAAMLFGWSHQGNGGGEGARFLASRRLLKPLQSSAGHFGITGFGMICLRIAHALMTSPRVAALLVMSLLTSCLEPALTMAAILTIPGGPFVANPSTKSPVDPRKSASFEEEDLLSLVLAFDAWQTGKQAGADDSQIVTRYDQARTRFSLCPHSLRHIAWQRQRLLDGLARLGILALALALIPLPMLNDTPRPTFAYAFNLNSATRRDLVCGILALALPFYHRSGSGGTFAVALSAASINFTGPIRPIDAILFGSQSAFSQKSSPILGGEQSARELFQGIFDRITSWTPANVASQADLSLVRQLVTELQGHLLKAPPLQQPRQ